jgi:hypothetical protein
MRFVSTLMICAPLALAVAFTPGRAAADVGKNEASGTAKGTVGGGLLGAELVLVIEAAAGVKSPWLYLAGGVAGAAGGAVGGYFIERDASPRVSMLLLAGGLTLAIPTTVAVLSATAYEPPADYLQDTPPGEEPVADPPQPSTAPNAPPAAAPPPAEPAAPAPAAPAPAAPTTSPPGPSTPTSRAPAKRPRVARATLAPLHVMPPALLDVTPRMLALSVPAVEITNTYTRAELELFGADQSTEVHIPVLNVTF